MTSLATSPAADVIAIRSHASSFGSPEILRNSNVCERVFALVRRDQERR